MFGKLFSGFIGLIIVILLITTFLPTIFEIASWVIGTIVIIGVLMIIHRIVRKPRSRDIHHHHHY